MEDSETDERAYPWFRLVGVFLFVLAFALIVYQLLEAARPSAGLISISFLVLLPIALTALLTFLADPWKTRTKGQYFALSGWLMLAVFIASVVLLQEGTICVVMLMPVWVPSSLFGAWITWKLRHRSGDGRTYCSTLILAPLLAMTIEAALPLPTAEETVTRSTVIAASPETLWPLVEGIPNVRPGEGRWNITQDLIGVPRPRGARLVGTGIGADRHALWGDGIRFRERIVAWERGRRIHWTFHFDDFQGWEMTDRHLLPDSSHFKVVRGGYDLEPLGGGRTRVTLSTTYRASTLVNGYGRLWGRLILGDLENNLLALISQRAAEKHSG